MSIRRFIIATAMCCGFLPIAAAAAPRSDEAAGLDLVSRATQSVDSGLALARDQTNAGELLGAMATLERLLINHPEADQVQLMHASLLCRLDDRHGASVEFEALRRRDFSDRAWMDAIAPCAVTSR